MSYKIENERILVELKTQGAEITRLFDKEKNQEIIWKNNPNIWKYQAPILFPKIGTLNPSQYIVSGNVYTMENHGFLRTSNFEVESHTNSDITFILKSNDKTLQQYPYLFEFKIMYKIEHNSLNILINIGNKDIKVMPFELGFHPAFNIKSYLTTKLVFPTQFVERYSYLNKSELMVRKKTRNVIHIAKRFFDHRGTLIYRGINTPIVMVTPNYRLKFETTISPYLAIWSKDEAFVCIEPWTHLPDLFENKLNWISRDNIINLAKNESKSYSIKMTIE